MNNKQIIGTLIRVVGAISCCMILTKISVEINACNCFFVLLLHLAICIVATLTDVCYQEKEKQEIPTFLKILSLIVNLALTFVSFDLGHLVFAGASILVGSISVAVVTCVN